jgi:hypothetical protein
MSCDARERSDRLSSCHAERPFQDTSHRPSVVRAMSVNPSPLKSANVSSAIGIWDVLRWLHSLETLSHTSHSLPFERTTSSFRSPVKLRTAAR